MEPPSEMDHWGLACSKTPLHRQGVEGTAQAQKAFPNASDLCAAGHAKCKH